jgi:two-component system, chemotaxis family, chemotaxis protein CheY
LSAKRRVLIVEDSPAMRHLLSLAVQRLPGVAIDQAADGVAALKALRAAASAPYDLVFLDLNMPRMDGLKLLGLLQGDPAAARTTIAVVTTTESTAIEQQARSLGARYFVRKPASRRAVDKILSEVFGWAAAMP